MAGVIVVFVFQILLFGFTRTDCPEPCNECKEISSGDYQGIWTLIETNSSSCQKPIYGKMCLYQDTIGRNACMCDPGNHLYTPCEGYIYGYILRHGYCPGNDIYNIDTTLAECAQLCNSHTTCKAFMFYNNITCFLKTKSCTTTNTTNVFYSKTELVAPNGYTVRPGDCPGNDIYNIINTTLAECTQHCNSITTCKAFMFYNNITCFLKTKSCTTTDTTNPLNAFYSKTGVIAPNEYLVRKGDCPGNDIYHINTNLADCTQRCNSNPYCEAFMFYNNIICFLKTKSCTTTDTTNPLNVFYSKTVWEGGLCYNDTAEPKLYNTWKVLPANSVENCRNYCSSQTDNYYYIGLESTDLDGGNMCYCGNIEPPTDTHKIVDPSNCGVSCPGNSSETCGAFNFINVWPVIPLWSV